MSKSLLRPPVLEGRVEINPLKKDEVLAGGVLVHDLGPGQVGPLTDNE